MYLILGEGLFTGEDRRKVLLYKASIELNSTSKT